MMDLQKIKDALAVNRDKIYRTMINVARRQDTISYSGLFGEYGLDMNDISHRNAAGRFLYEIGEEEHNAKRPILTAVVMGEQTNMPGGGFFNFANDLGFPVTKAAPEADKEAFFVGELNKVYQYWSQNKERS